MPMAMLNQLHAGQWAGDVNNSTGLQISNPVAGILGNTLQLGVNTLLPPIFPPGGKLEFYSRAENNGDAARLLDQKPVSSAFS